jgi:hypothetical protein
VGPAAEETRSAATEVCVRLEPISPELVLVDPALALPARALLPLPGEFRPGWWTALALGAAPALADEPVAVVPEEPEPVVAPVVAEPAPRRRRGRRAVAALAFAATTGAAFVVGYAAGDRDGNAPVSRVAAGADESAPEAAAPTTPTPQATTTTVTVPKPAVRRPAHVAPRAKPAQPGSQPTAPRPKPRRKPVTTTASRPARRQPVPSTAATPKPTPKPPVVPTAPVGFVPARTWVWVAVDGAAAYRVTFERAGRPVFRATTRAPRIDLPASVKFSAGRYKWRVVPVVGGVDRTPIVDSSFTVR